MATRNNKRSQDDRNLKTLRELAKLPVNKKCFDCHQRGPTYVNMTIGSFVCTSCSGMLRGLNPQHRVKSITMTVFTPEEIEFIRSRGNEYCRYVWLGTYDVRSTIMEPEPRDDHKVKDFMIQKYERKRWYVDPDKASQAMMDRAIEESAALATAGSSGPSSHNSTPLSENMPDTKPLSSLLGKNTTPLVIQCSQPQVFGTKLASSQSQEKVPVMNIFESSDLFSSSNEAGSNETASPAFLTVGAKAAANHSASQAFFGGFQAPAHQPGMQGSISFPTTFDSTPSPVVSSPQFGQPVAQQSVLAQSQNIAGPPPPPSADRYAALADLDSLFHSEPEPPAATITPPTSSWPGNTSSATVANNNNNSSSSLFGNPQPAVNALFATASVNPFTSTTSTWSNSAVSNPHQGSQGTMGLTPNPFQMVGSSSPQSIMAQQNTIYGQFGGVGSPAIGNPPQVDNFSSFNNFSQLGGSITAPGQFFPGYSNSIVGSPNGIPTSPFAMNGGDTGISFPWGGVQGANNLQQQQQVAWPGMVGRAQIGGGGPFPNQKLPVNMVSNQPGSANPFMTNSNPIRSNPGNPFL